MHPFGKELAKKLDLEKESPSPIMHGLTKPLFMVLKNHPFDDVVLKVTVGKFILIHSKERRYETV